MTDESFLLAEITVQRVLVDGEDQITVETRDGSGDTPPLLELLGMLRMAEDTVMRHAMGEIEDDD